MIFQIFSQNKHKRKVKNRCHIKLKTAQEVTWPVSGVKGFRSDDFVVVGKDGFCPKLKEARGTFSSLFFTSQQGRWAFSRPKQATSQARGERPDGVSSRAVVPVPSADGGATDAMDVPAWVRGEHYATRSCSGGCPCPLDLYHPVAV